MNNSLIKVGIICPCPDEYTSCKEILKLHNETKLAGRFISSTKEKGIEVIAIQAGTGKIACASATQLVIDQFEPDFIFDVGAAGSLSEELNIKDMVCAKCSYEYDSRTGEILDKTSPDDCKTVTLANKTSYKKVINEFLSWVKDTMGFTIKVGNIACGERDVDDAEFKRKLREKLKGVIACNWETSAVLKTAQLNKINSLSFRVITDRADEEMNKDYNANNKKALDIMFPVLKKFIFEGWMTKIYKIFFKDISK